MKGISFLKYQLCLTDKDLQNMVIADLIGGCGKSTLRTLIEHGANLEASLDQPSQMVQWPHSSHMQKMSQVAKSALSLLHRQVWIIIILSLNSILLWFIFYFIMWVCLKLLKI